MRRCGKAKTFEDKRRRVRRRVRLRHPSRDQLAGFMRGELPAPELGPVIRHLLTGCPRCAEVTRRLWNLGEQAPIVTKATAGAEAAGGPPAGRRRRAGAVWT